MWLTWRLLVVTHRVGNLLQSSVLQETLSVSELHSSSALFPLLIAASRGAGSTDRVLDYLLLGSSDGSSQCGTEVIKPHIGTARKLCPYAATVDDPPVSDTN